MKVLNFRFTAQEVDAMKRSIRTHIANEQSAPKTAWRLRSVLHGIYMLHLFDNKSKARKAERELRLYEYLTKDDLPNWQND